MKHTSYILLLVSAMLLAVTTAFAKQGDSWCDPIPLGKDYTATISKTGTVYYSANTFDLPLAVYFKTSTPNQPPIVEMDFTCKPGVYEDSILCSLFCKTGGSGIEFDMPHKPELKVTTLSDGSFAYYIAMGKTYRDLLLQMGIDYNVVVYIKVTYKSTGTMTMTPDAFGNCMDGGKFMHVGDTIKVLPNDKSRHVIVPYVQWMEDSIRYVWDGTAPLQLAVATECEFDPEDNSNPKIANFKELKSPKDTFKLTSERLKYYVNGGDYSSEAGMFFAKWYTTGSGTLKIERVPQAPPRDGATLLRYNKATDVVASDTLVKTYAIPFTWTEDIKFITPTDHVFKLYIGTDPKFTPKQAIASYQFLAATDGHWLGLYADEMEALWKKTSEQYLYIKIWCTEKTTITPQRWYPADCSKKGAAIYLPPKDTVMQIDRRDARIFKLHYPQWKNGDITLQFDQTQKCFALFADSCYITSNTSASNLLPNGAVTLQNKNVKKVTSSTIDSWEPRVIDDNGFIYLRLYTDRGGGGHVTLTTTAPEEQDPAPIVYPAATVHVTCGEKESSGAQNITVKVSVEQDIIIYNATSTKVAEWHQKPTDAPHTIKLQPGDYTLSGKDEKIAILIKN